MKRELIVGTRSSALALWQTRYVMKQLQAVCPTCILKEQTMTTIGDRRLAQALHTFGGKGAFTEELETALLDGRLDFAVHSLKDLPTSLPDGLVIGAIPARENPLDAWVSKDGRLLEELPKGAKVGTSSLRRMAQLKAQYPHLQAVPIRGNVQTRLKKMETEVDGVILAAAGLIRLDLAHLITSYLPKTAWLYAPGQGALAVECRKDDTELLAILQQIHDEQTAREVAAERAFLQEIEGGCQVPLGVAMVTQGKDWKFTGGIFMLDGSQQVIRHVRGTGTLSKEAGATLCKEIMQAGGDAIWQAVRRELEEQS